MLGSLKHFTPDGSEEALKNVIIGQLLTRYCESLAERQNDFLEDGSLHEILENNVDTTVLYKQLSASINILQWLSIEERESLGDELPLDPSYPKHYARWKDWIVLESGYMQSVCECLSAAHLRSVLLSITERLLNNLGLTVFRLLRVKVVKDLSLLCGISEGDFSKVIARAFRLNGAPDLLSFLPSEAGLGFILRDRGGAAEEDLGIIRFQCITNNREPDTLIKLLTLKSIFSRQLPKMPREYITRLTLDRHHYSFCLLKKERVIGGVCFRPFSQNKFAEIVFLAVTSTEQVKGYGTRLMNHLKEFVKKRGIEYFLTYADNYAVGYFKKQGFSPRITMPRERWLGFIKEYDGTTLMECYISPSINHLKLGDLFILQRRRVHQAMRLLKCLTVYSGQALWLATDTTREPDSAPKCEDDLASIISLDPKTIIGFAEAGWSDELEKKREEPPIPLNDQVLNLLEIMHCMDSSWPFRKPVSKLDAPDYHEHIKHPMDISTMRKHAKAKLYKSKAEVEEHLRLIFDNCRYYNLQSSIYYKLADELEA